MLLVVKVNSGSGPVPIASDSVSGTIRVGTNLSISEGVLSADDQSYTLSTASSSVLGGIKVGDNLTIAEGVLSADDQSYTLPTASSSVLGGVKVGDRLSISDGILSADVQGSVTEVIKTETGTLSAADVTGTILNNYGQTDDVTLTLPTAAAGLTFLCVLGTTVAKYFRLKAGTNDKIYLSGSAGADNEYVGTTSATAGASISFSTFQVDTNAWDWIAVIVSGTWVAE